MRVKLCDLDFLRKFISSNMNDGEERVLLGIKAYNYDGEMSNIVITNFINPNLVQFQKGIEPFNKDHGVEMEVSDIIRLIFML